MRVPGHDGVRDARQADAAHRLSRLRRSGAGVPQGLADAAGFAARVVAYDVKTDSPDARVRDAKRADYAAAGVEDGGSAPAALAGAPLVFSVVTADQAEAAALAALPGLAGGAFFFDCNSCAPQTKARSAERESRRRAAAMSTSP